MLQVIRYVTLVVHDTVTCPTAMLLRHYVAFCDPVHLCSYVLASVTTVDVYPLVK